MVRPGPETIDPDLKISLVCSFRLGAAASPDAPLPAPVHFLRQDRDDLEPGRIGPVVAVDDVEASARLVIFESRRKAGGNDNCAGHRSFALGDRRREMRRSMTTAARGNGAETGNSGSAGGDTTGSLRGGITEATCANTANSSSCRSARTRACVSALARLVCSKDLLAIRIKIPDYLPRRAIR